MELSSLDPTSLESRLQQLLSNERGIQVEFLFHLLELDRRRLYEPGHTNLWEYCRKKLGLLEGACWRRTQAVALSFGAFPRRPST